MEIALNWQGKYKISLLRDFSRLQEIYALNHDALSEVGDISPRQNGMLVINPRLDKMPETSILVADEDHKIIGTISFTLDGKEGMHLEKWFKREVDAIRTNGDVRLGTAWRFAIERKHRNNRRLVLEMICAAFAVGRKQQCNKCLIVSTYRHIGFYKKFMEAEIVVQRQASLDGKRLVDIALLMIDVEETWKRIKKVIS